MTTARVVYLPIENLQGDPPDTWEDVSCPGLPGYIVLSWKKVYSDLFRLRLTSKRTDRNIRMSDLSIAWKKRKEDHPQFYHNAARSYGKITGWGIKRSHFLRAAPLASSLRITYHVEGV